MGGRSSEKESETGKVNVKKSWLKAICITEEGREGSHIRRGEIQERNAKLL
jgi:hypothetical protein